MGTAGYDDSRIIAILEQARAGTPVPALCREHGMSSSTFYKWRAKYGGRLPRQADICPSLQFATPPAKSTRRNRARGRSQVTAEATHCSTCMLNATCLPLGLSRADLARMDELVKERIHLQRDGALYRQGDPTGAIYGLRSGSIKTQIEDAGGQVQITGFLLPGEVLGLDGLMEDSQVSHAIALEDSEVCVIHLDEMDRLAAQLPSLQMQLRRLMSREIGRSHQQLLALGSLNSEQRVAAFLVNMHGRLQLLGHTSSEFFLRMSRGEIGNFLGLTLETVSRLFSRFARDGLIQVHQRKVDILDLAALQALAGSDCG